jgi:hypothetical protein
MNRKCTNKNLIRTTYKHLNVTFYAAKYVLINTMKAKL